MSKNPPHRTYYASIPDGERRVNVGPFNTLGEAYLFVANLDTDTPITGIEYWTAITSRRYEQIRRDRYVMDHPPQSVIDIDTDLRAESIRRWKERVTERRDKEKRCKQCQSVLSPEPMLEKWGFCSSECERDYKEIHP